jgi:hypothetical protein
MDAPLRKLTLAFPKTIEASILDVLDDMEPPLQGYSFMTAKGRGPDMQLSAVSERVQGAGNVVLVKIIVPENDVDAILEAIRINCSRPNISYWVEPILDFGRLQ